MFNKIYSFQNLHAAYLKARMYKRYRKEILKFGYNLEDNLLDLQRELLSQTYQHGGYRTFIVCDSKKREIKAAPFRDRVVHHALCNIIEPIFNKGFVYDSFACRKEKGTHKAIKRLERFLRVNRERERERERERDDCAAQIYCLQCDISKYFASIDHQILFSLLEKKIVDRKVLWLIDNIIKSDEETPNKGIPIGNLTSQLFANIYLNELDYFVKHILRIKHYIRYMDDFLILSRDKKQLHYFKKQIKEFLENTLNLKLHPNKVNIFPTEKGIDFLGYRIYDNYRLLRKNTVKRFIRRKKVYQRKLDAGLMTEEKFEECVQSWIAYAKFGNSWNLRKKLDLI